MNSEKLMLTPPSAQPQVCVQIPVDRRLEAFHVSSQRHPLTSGRLCFLLLPCREAGSSSHSMQAPIF